MYFADGHCDFLYGMVNEGYDLAKPVGRQSVSLERLKKGGVKLQFFAAWIDVKHKHPYLQQFMSMAELPSRRKEAMKKDRAKNPMPMRMVFFRPIRLATRPTGM